MYTSLVLIRLMPTQSLKPYTVKNTSLVLNVKHFDLLQSNIN